MAGDKLIRGGEGVYPQGTHSVPVTDDWVSSTHWLKCWRVYGGASPGIWPSQTFSERKLYKAGGTVPPSLRGENPRVKHTVRAPRPTRAARLLRERSVPWLGYEQDIFHPEHDLFQSRGVSCVISLIFFPPPPCPWFSLEFFWVCFWNSWFGATWLISSIFHLSPFVLAPGKFPQLHLPTHLLIFSPIVCCF